MRHIASVEWGLYNEKYEYIKSIHQFIKYWYKVKSRHVWNLNEIYVIKSVRVYKVVLCVWVKFNTFKSVYYIPL